MALSEITTTRRELDTTSDYTQACPHCGASVMVVASTHGAWSWTFDVDACETGAFDVWEHDDDTSDVSVLVYRKRSAFSPEFDGATRHDAHSCAPRMVDVRETNAQYDADAGAWATIRERTLEAVARSMGMSLAPAHDDDAPAFDLIFDDDDAHAFASDDASDDDVGGHAM